MANVMATNKFDSDYHESASNALDRRIRVANKLKCACCRPHRGENRTGEQTRLKKSWKSRKTAQWE